jgi:hypothetical protein
VTVLKKMVDDFIKAHCNTTDLSEDEKFSIEYPFVAGAYSFFTYLEMSLNSMPLKVFLDDYVKLGNELDDYIDRLQKNNCDGKEINIVKFKRPKKG